MANGRGFTLVEILIAMLITSILVFGLHAAYRQAHALWTRAEDGRGPYYFARVLTETLREELAGAYILPPDPNEQAPRDRAFRLTSAGGDMTELCFLTLAPVWRSDVESSRTVRVCYRFGEGQDAGGTVLQRSEVLCLGAQPLGQEISEVLTDDLAEFTVAVYDPNGDGSADSWKESYESDDQPPKAVKVFFRWNARDRPGRPPEQVQFESVMPIPCEGPVLPGAG